MLNPQETQQVRDFCEHVCAIDGETGEYGASDFERRACVRIGKKLTQAKQYGAAIAIPENCTPADLFSRIAPVVELARDDEGAERAYLVLYHRGDSEPKSRGFRVDLEPTEDAAGGDPVANLKLNDPNAFNGAAAAVTIEVARLMMRNNDSLLSAVLSTRDEMRDLQTQLFLAQINGDANSAAERSAAFRDAMQAVAPAAAAMAPVVAAAGADWLKARADAARAEAAANRGEAGPPEDPTERTAYHLARLDTEATGIVAHLRANPSAITDDQIAEMDQGLTLLGVVLTMMKAERAQGETKQAA